MTKDPDLILLDCMPVSYTHLMLADAGLSAFVGKVNMDRNGGVDPVSYTHLDVYKRQPYKLTFRSVLQCSESHDRWIQ